MKHFITLLFLLIAAGHSFACSTFLLSKDGHYVFGRNYDWVTGNGMIITNARGVAKNSFMPGEAKSISWTSLYGSTTFNQFGKEFPHGGMNEKGLVVELMWLNETLYPAADERAALNELQWIQYQLDNCASIEEVIATDKTIRINRAGAAPLHYLVADANGKAATIEFLNGKMIVHKEKELAFPVLTNTIYKDAVQQYQSHKDSKTFNNSVERFATACSMIQQYQAGNNGQDPVHYAFSILDKVAQKGYTKWSIVYDITNRQVYWITDEQPQRKQLSFSAVDFSCKGISATSLDLNSHHTGMVSNYFTPLSFEQNRSVITTSARESRSQVDIQPASITRAAEFYKQVSCKR